MFDPPSDSDTEISPAVLLVNQAFVDHYFPGEDPIGREIRLGLPQSFGASSAPNYRFTIVGVMANIMNRGLALPPAPQLTALFRQTPDLNYGFKNLIVRTALDPLRLAPSITAATLRRPPERLAPMKKVGVLVTPRRLASETSALTSIGPWLRRHCWKWEWSCFHWMRHLVRWPRMMK